MSHKAKNAAVQELLRKIEERFGIDPSVFKGYAIYERKKGEFWMASPETLDVDFPFASRAGFRFAQVFSKGGFRLSTCAIQLFGRYATKNVVELTESEREEFIRGRDLSNRWGVEKGQVIVRYKRIPLGSAVFTEGRLKNQVPTARRVKAG